MNTSTMRFEQSVQIEVPAASLSARVRGWWQRRAALDELYGLDDATLKDIGLHRSQIRSVVADLERAGRTTGTQRSAVGVWLAEVAERLRRRRERRVTADELTRLNARLLRDIGLIEQDVQDLRAGRVSLETLDERRHDRARRPHLERRATLRICHDRSGRVCDLRTAA